MAGSKNAPIEQQSEKERKGPLATLQQIGRVSNFWARGGQVYFGYKGAQVQPPMSNKLDYMVAHVHIFYANQMLGPSVHVPFGTAIQVQS